MSNSTVWRSGNESPKPFDLHAAFGNARPTELEVGCGKGLFLLRESLRNPDVNYFGIERSLKHASLAAARLGEHGVSNVQIVAADVREFIVRLGDETIAAVHVYFPDPWWKRRHHKRRIVTRDFVAQVARILVPGGFASLATDVETYFRIMLKMFDDDDRFVRTQPPDPTEPTHDLDYLTHFERKYRQQGRTVYRCRYQRVPSSPQSV